jgi:DNA modification methylase
MSHQILLGDCRDRLKEIPDNSIDSIVTDPPYELGFMGKSWDASGVAYDVELWQECLRVLKPGGHLLSFGGSRTYHRMACAIEDAGFQIRDQIMWVYGSGFPKSLNISKAIDKAAGAERQIVGEKITGGIKRARPDDADGFSNPYTSGQTLVPVTAPATAEAEEWQGWGTALKPAHEPIVLARKPLDGTVANNVLTHGVGGINIDGCRVPSDDGFEKAWDKPVSTNISATSQAYSIGTGQSHVVDLGSNRPVGGRFPANFIHDGSDEVLQLFPQVKTGTIKPHQQNSESDSFGLKGKFITGSHTGDSGSAARFFYCAKASKKDRNEGLDDFAADKPVFGDDGGTYKGLSNSKNPQANHHPTVKPTDLMRYLCRLVTPPNGTVLDPFTGSGSTGKAAVLEGFSFIGVEQSEEYIAIAEARIQSAKENK